MTLQTKLFDMIVADKKKYQTVKFLAEMSSSRSDFVTQFVRSCFHSSIPFFLVSLEFYLVLKSLNGVSRKF